LEKRKRRSADRKKTLGRGKTIRKYSEKANIKVPAISQLHCRGNPRKHFRLAQK